MLNEGDKLWFELKRLWILFPFCAVMFLYLMYLCQYDLIQYTIHKADYELLDAEVIDLDMREYSTLRGDEQRYFAKIRILGEDEKNYTISRDKSDYIGKKIKVAVHRQNPKDICRIAWMRPKDGIWILTCGLGWILVLLLLGKIVSCFMLKKVFGRIDSAYALEVKEKRKQISFAESGEQSLTISKIKRDANLAVTIETVQIYCLRGENGEVVKSPKMLGHTILRKGDRILPDKDTETEVGVNWSQYFI